MWVYRHHKRVCTESWLGEKNPLPRWGIKVASVACRSDGVSAELHPYPKQRCLGLWARLGNQVPVCCRQMKKKNVTIRTYCRISTRTRNREGFWVWLCQLVLHRESYPNEYFPKERGEVKLLIKKKKSYVLYKWVVCVLCFSTLFSWWRTLQCNTWRRCWLARQACTPATWVFYI